MEINGRSKKMKRKMLITTFLLMITIIISIGNSSVFAHEMLVDNTDINWAGVPANAKASERDFFMVYSSRTTY